MFYVASLAPHRWMPHARGKTNPCLNLAEVTNIEMLKHPPRTQSAERFFASSPCSHFEKHGLDTCAYNLAFPQLTRLLDSYKR